MEIVTAPETSVWIVVSTERDEFSSNRFMLTVTKVPLGAVALAAVVSISVVLLMVSVTSGVADSVALAADKVSSEAVVLAGCDFASVESGKADVSGVGRVFPPVGLRSMSEAPGMLVVASLSVTLQSITSMLLML